MSPRTASGSLHTEHTARKTHHCEWDCGSPIAAGTRYVRAALPPMVDPNSSPHWWTMRAHGATLYDCPTYGGPGPVDPRVEACEDLDAIGPRTTARRGLSSVPRAMRGKQVTTVTTRGDRL